MSKYETLERLHGSLVVNIKDFINNRDLSEGRDPRLDDIENLIADLIHSQGIAKDVKDYSVLLVIRKQNTI